MKCFSSVSMPDYPVEPEDAERLDEEFESDLCDEDLTGLKYRPESNTDRNQIQR
jgi:hypothetical protein